MRQIRYIGTSPRYTPSGMSYEGVALYWDNPDAGMPWYVYDHEGGTNGQP